MNSLITRTALAAAMALAASSAASAAPAASPDVALTPLYGSVDAVLNGPIHLDRVQIAPAGGINYGFNYLGIVTVAFTNTSAVPATDIVFAVRGNDGSIIDRYEDVGSYEKGATIRHSFHDLRTDPNQRLEVDTATFADGSVWNNPGPATPVSRRQSR